MKSRYEHFHQLVITDEALQAAVDLSVRYVPDRFLPGKAADLIDEAGSRVRMHRAPHTDEVHELSLDLQQIRRMKKAALEPQRLEDASELSRCEVELEAKFSELRAGRSTTANPPTVTPEDIAAVVARWRGVPVSSMAPEEEARRPASGEDELSAGKQPE